jgi:hypothetical protein
VAKVASECADGNSRVDSCHVEFDNIVRKSSYEFGKIYFFNHFKFNPNKNMNPKQTIPLIATLAPVAPVIAPVIPALLVGGVVFLVLKCLLSDNDTEKKPETAPANAETENRRKEAEISAFRQIPVKLAAAPVPTVISLFSVPAQAPQETAPQIPLPAQKKFIVREDLANIFQRGARALTRTAAVAALKNLGFGKTAAYDALSPNGRFSAWLQCAPDGIITWKS